MNTLLLTSLMFAFLGLLESTSANADQGVSHWSPQDPVVTIVNTSSQDEVYDVETDSAASKSAFQSCVGCITVGAGKTIKFHPGPFNGALTGSHHTGTRHELNFASTPGSAWYDDDMERGMSDETLGPSDNRKKNGGTESGVVGEHDTLAKANAAWRQTDSGKQQALLDSGYLGGSKHELTMVRMDAFAPQLVVAWLQMDAEFNAYVGAGSVFGKIATEVDHVSDKQTSFVDTNKMTITIY